MILNLDSMKYHKNTMSEKEELEFSYEHLITSHDDDIDKREINNHNISALINNNKFMYLDVTIKSFFRPWYVKLVELIDSYYYSYVDKRINSFLLLT